MPRRCRSSSPPAVDNGVGYAPQSQGSGRMPGFGAMLTEDQLAAIIDYVRSL